MTEKDMENLILAYDAAEDVEEAVRILIGNVGPAYENGVLDDLHRMVNVLTAYSSVPEDEFWSILNDRGLSASDRARRLMN